MNTSDFPKGARFKVVREGAYLSGLRLMVEQRSNGRIGIRRDLELGDVIVSRGFGPDWGSDPGYGIHFDWPGDEQHVDYTEFKPGQGALFGFGPADGYLERID